MFRYLLAGFLVIAMAGVSSAEHKDGHNPGGGAGTTTLGDLDCATNQIAKFNGASGTWECASDQTGSTITIRDLNDDAVATITLIGTVATIQDADGRDRNVLVEIYPSGIFTQGAATVSTDSTCAGTQYVLVANAEAFLGSPFSSVAEPVYAACPIGCGVTNVIYLPSSDVPIFLAGPVYKNNSGGECREAGEDVMVFPAEDVTSQIAGIGTPPFYWDLK